MSIAEEIQATAEIVNKMSDADMAGGELLTSENVQTSVVSFHRDVTSSVRAFKCDL
jgi:hypothetical protein